MTKHYNLIYLVQCLVTKHCNWSLPRSTGHVARVQYKISPWRWIIWLVLSNNHHLVPFYTAFGPFLPLPPVSSVTVLPVSSASLFSFSSSSLPHQAAGRPSSTLPASLSSWPRQLTLPSFVYINMFPRTSIFAALALVLAGQVVASPMPVAVRVRA